MRLLVAGTVVLLAAWGLPLSRLGVPPFTAHMTMHMAVVAIAAPLLALGLAGGRFDPVRARPWVFAAIPASMAELVGVWAWHTPALHHAARHTSVGLVLEQGTFLVAGLWLWLAAVGGDPSQRRSRVAGGVTAMLLTSMHMTLLGALLTLTRRPLFEHGAHPGLLTAAQDQQLGGAVMLLVGGVAYLAGGLWLTADALRARPEPS